MIFIFNKVTVWDPTKIHLLAMDVYYASYGRYLYLVGSLDITFIQIKYPRFCCDNEDMRYAKIILEINLIIVPHVFF